MMMGHRIIVHVPSLTLTPAQRAAIANVPLTENAQMARLCDVADPLCDVVYVAPFPVDEAVEQFWEKLLEVGGVEAPRSRLRIIYPENYSRLPERMPLTAKLLASPRALRRLRMIVQVCLYYDYCSHSMFSMLCLPSGGILACHLARTCTYLLCRTFPFARYKNHCRRQLRYSYCYFR